LGLPQVIEFFLQSGLKNCLKKAFIAASRLVASLSVVSTSRCFQLYLCKDKTKNVEMIVNFLEADHGLP
jgi:hypothetical protein